MPTGVARPRSRPRPRVGRLLFETVAGGGAPLKVDRDKGIIYGVKVLGRFSKNTHDVDGITGTEYSDRARRQAVELYEGQTVRVDHPDRKNPTAARSVHDTFGQLRNCRIDEAGDVRADLHYLKSHDLAEAVCEDVERGLGVYGLSHNARAGKESVREGRLIIEELELVRSVDLVDKPATNRNLWESQAVAKTFRQVLEAAGLKGKKKSAAAALLEDDGGYMEAPVDGPTDGGDGDHEAALKAGFRAAIVAVLDDESMDVKAQVKKIAELLKTEEKLLGSDGDGEVEEDEETDKKDGLEESDETDDKDGLDDDKKQREESVRESRLAALERKDKARDLCEAESVVPSKALLKALTAPGLSTADQKEILGEFKTKAGPTRGGPRSRSAHRNVAEATKPGTGKPSSTKGWLNRVR